jgi:Zn-dependent peptidase ImmA (M78 family)
MTSSQRDTAIAAGTLATIVSTWIEQKFELPPPGIPFLRGISPEVAARMVRVEWGLGERPIKNVVHLLEAKGVRMFSLPVDSSSVDAFSVWYQDLPFVFLNPRKSGERGRMDAAHELGHLVMHADGVPSDRAIELEADAFAASFLMPLGDVLANTPRVLSLKTIHKLKKRWSVSAMAMVHRLRVLDLITEWQYRRFCIELSQAGYRRSEPDGLPRDDSQIFSKVFGHLRTEGVSRGSIARELHITPSELDSLLVGLVIAAVPDSDSDSPPAKRPPIKTKRSHLRAV